MEILLDRVRCFVEPGIAPIKPLTILVGENSSGKSSFLALVRIAFQLAAEEYRPNFNSEPFFLGAYDQIAHFRGGAYGRAKSFEVGLSDQIALSGDAKETASLVGTFEKQGSQAALSSLSLKLSDASAVMTRTAEDWKLNLQTPEWTGELEKKDTAWQSILSTMSDLRFLSVRLDFSRLSLAELGIPEDVRPSIIESAKRLTEAIDHFRDIGRRVMHATAPVRSKPSRTYNPVDDTPEPEGGHVPMMLARLKFGDARAWERISRSINEFGNASGLFTALNLKTLGSSDSDPFQMEVRLGGPPRNIIDVGYGVNQVLPIVSDLSFNLRGGRTYLLQQPEVHLHPRAQAALGTFLCSAASIRRNTIIVETHSDYLIDRVRSDVRDKKSISAGAISVLFFE